MERDCAPFRRCRPPPRSWLPPSCPTGGPDRPRRRNAERWRGGRTTAASVEDCSTPRILATQWMFRQLYACPPCLPIHLGRGIHVPRSRVGRVSRVVRSRSCAHDHQDVYRPLWGAGHPTSCRWLYSQIDEEMTISCSTAALLPFGPWSPLRSDAELRAGPLKRRFLVGVDATGRFGE